MALAATAVVFVGTVAWTRHISLGSIVGATTFPLAVWLILHPPLPVVAAALAGGAFIVCRHSANIPRLRAGTEHVFPSEERSDRSQLTVVGGGSWGTALAIVLRTPFSTCAALGLRSGPGRAHGGGAHQ